MKKLYFAIGLGLALVSAGAFSIPITGVTATTTLGDPGDSGSLLLHIVDGSGLTSYTTGATHAAGTPGNAWVSTNSLSGTITSNLGGLYDLDGMAVWNFNSRSAIGVKDLTIDVSLDGNSFSPLVGAPTQFASGTSFTAETAELFAFTMTAQFVRFNLMTNWDTRTTIVGLSEVMFTGTEPPPPMPVPGTLALVGLALAGLGWT